MQKDFIKIDDDVSRGNLIISNISQFERKSYTKDPSVKLVLSGKEHYKIEGRNYTLSKNRFLIVDNNSSEDIHIDARERVKGICIYPDKDLLNEVAKSRTSSNESLLDSPFDNEEITLIHNQLTFNENRTGQFLKEQIPEILQLSDSNNASNLNSFMITLAECLVEDQLELMGKLKNVQSAKKGTKEELYRRVSTAKNFVQDNFTEKISLDDLAQEALLSKYHFTRSFKALYQMSPYQYLLQLRLNKAKELLELDYSYNEVSQMIGFSDGKNLRKAIAKLGPI